MAVPPRINDGDWQSITRDGAAGWRSPFALVGDPVAFEYVTTHRQDEATYRPFTTIFGVNEWMTALLTPSGLAYLIDEGPADGIGCGLVEFKRTFASIPRIRFEYSSYVYPIQILFSGGTEGNSLGEIPYPLAATVKYEYSLVPFSPQAALKVYVLNGVIYEVGYTTPIAPGTTILAEDSVPSIYKAGIFQRRSIYATIPAYTTP